jgi:hypothetical protein
MTKRNERGEEGWNPGCLLYAFMVLAVLILLAYKAMQPDRDADGCYWSSDFDDGATYNRAVYVCD